MTFHEPEGKNLFKFLITKVYLEKSKMIFRTMLISTSISFLSSKFPAPHKVGHRYVFKWRLSGELCSKELTLTKETSGYWEMVLFAWGIWPPDNLTM